MENFNAADVAQKIMSAVQKEYKDLNKLNVMILGKTGVGKSTLINNMFSRNLADTGVGKRMTSEIKKWEVPDFPLAIYDTPGLELGGEFSVDNLLEAVKSQIEEGIKSGDISKAIHCIWYCISTPSHRFEQTEIDFLKRFLDETESYNVPVIIVLTQSYSKKDAKELKSIIENENLNVAKVVPVLAEDYEIDEDYTAKAYGLDKLSEVMNNVIPDGVKKTFVAVQIANLQLKKDRATAIVATSAVAAAAIGAVPIPFSDAALLVPEQISMLAGITAVFGLPVEKATLMTIITATIGTTGTTVLGKSVVTGLLKLIPGVGSAVGGAISATTAAALSSALGEAYIAILIKVVEGELSMEELTSPEGREQITDIFQKRLKLKRDSKGDVIDN